MAGVGGGDGEADPLPSSMEDCTDRIGLEHFRWGRGRERSYEPFKPSAPLKHLL